MIRRLNTSECSWRLSTFLFILLLAHTLEVILVGILHRVDKLSLLVLYVHLGSIEDASDLRPEDLNVAQNLLLKCKFALLWNLLVFQLGYHDLLLIRVQSLLERLVATVKYCHDLLVVDVNWVEYVLEDWRRLSVDHMVNENAIG